MVHDFIDHDRPNQRTRVGCSEGNGALGRPIFVPQTVKMTPEGDALGRNAEARVALERALKMDPQNELAISQLAELKRRTTAAVRAGDRNQ